MSWHEARDAAASLSYQGVQGHLVTITSAEENAFLTENLPPGLHYGGWIGASDEAVEGEWRWVVGPEAGTLFWHGGPDGTASGFADWHAGEPNNQVDEDYAMMGWSNDDWNDLNDSDTSWLPGGGFAVEFSVPEPSTYALAAIGLIGMAGVVRKRNLC